MSDRNIDVVAIGNAIVDVLSHAEDAFLDANGLDKGIMSLVDAERAEKLYGAMGPAVEISGGAAANTAAGVASLGGRAGFIGKVSNDQLGGIFRHDIRAAGVRFESSPSLSGVSTARCLIFVTPDAQRTMNTYLGACLELGPADIDADLVGHAQVTYLEGYLWDPPLAKEAFRKAADIAHQAGRKVSLSLSDPFCVERHRAEFVELVKNRVDILFANEHEICSLWQVTDFDAALRMTRDHCEVAALTRSEKGSVVLSGGEVHAVEAAKVARLVDTTGAGDLYAAGFLYGLTSGRGLPECGRIASLAAAEAISHYGARPETPLTELVLAEFA